MSVFVSDGIMAHGVSDSQIPRIYPPEESYYVNRHVFPQITPDEIPQPTGEIYRGVSPSYNAGMKEIHAYRNDDGTYRVKIIDTVKMPRTIGQKMFEFTDRNKTVIPRAGIQIIDYKSERPDGEILTLREV